MTYTRTCTHCGYTWDAYKEHPKACPHCHTYRWNLPLVRKRKHNDQLQGGAT